MITGERDSLDRDWRGRGKGEAAGTTSGVNSRPRFNLCLCQVWNVNLGSSFEYFELGKGEDANYDNESSLFSLSSQESYNDSEAAIKIGEEVPLLSTVGGLIRRLYSTGLNQGLHQEFTDRIDENTFLAGESWFFNSFSQGHCLLNGCNHRKEKLDLLPFEKESVNLIVEGRNSTLLYMPLIASVKDEKKTSFSRLPSLLLQSMKFMSILSYMFENIIHSIETEYGETFHLSISAWSLLTAERQHPASQKGSRGACSSRKMEVEAKDLLDRGSYESRNVATLQNVFLKLYPGQGYAKEKISTIKLPCSQVVVETFKEGVDLWLDLLINVGKLLSQQASTENGEGRGDSVDWNSRCASIFLKIDIVDSEGCEKKVKRLSGTYHEYGSLYISFGDFFNCGGSFNRCTTEVVHSLEELFVDCSMNEQKRTTLSATPTSGDENVFSRQFCDKVHEENVSILRKWGCFFSSKKKMSAKQPCSYLRNYLAPLIAGNTSVGMCLLFDESFVKHMNRTSKLMEFSVQERFLYLEHQEWIFKVLNLCKTCASALSNCFPIETDMQHVSGNVCGKNDPTKNNASGDIDSPAPPLNETKFSRNMSNGDLCSAECSGLKKDKLKGLWEAIMDCDGTGTDQSAASHPNEEKECSNIEISTDSSNYGEELLDVANMGGQMPLRPFEEIVKTCKGVVKEYTMFKHQSQNTQKKLQEKLVESEETIARQEMHIEYLEDESIVVMGRLKRIEESMERILDERKSQRLSGDDVGSGSQCFVSNVKGVLEIYRNAMIIQRKLQLFWRDEALSNFPTAGEMGTNDYEAFGSKIDDQWHRFEQLSKQLCIEIDGMCIDCETEEREQECTVPFCERCGNVNKDGEPSKWRSERKLLLEQKCTTDEKNKILIKHVDYLNLKLLQMRADKETLLYTMSPDKNGDGCGSIGDTLKHCLSDLSNALEALDSVEFESEKNSIDSGSAELQRKITNVKRHLCSAHDQLLIL
eukprot:Nk52_evm37s304 gene=Nk52_evmTU37s304